MGRTSSACSVTCSRFSSTGQQSSHMSAITTQNTLWTRFNVLDRHNQSGRQALTVGQQCRMPRDQAHVPLDRFLPCLRRPVVHVIPCGRRARRETEGRHVVEDLDAELVAAVQVLELRAGVEAREGILQANARPAFNERRCGGGLEVLTGMIMLMPCEQRTKGPAGGKAGSALTSPA